MDRGASWDTIRSSSGSSHSKLIDCFLICQMFRMAARNIKDNTSEPVSEEQIKAVLRRSLDEVLTLLVKLLVPILV